MLKEKFLFPEDANKGIEETGQSFHLNDCRLIVFPHPLDKSNLITLESNQRIPFEIKRVFWIYDLPNYAFRGNHVMKTTEEFVIALNGSFDVELDDGVNKQSFTLNKPDFGLSIRPTIWRTLKNFSPNTIVLAFTSKLFDKNDYISVYDIFKKMITTKVNEN